MKKEAAESKADLARKQVEIDELHSRLALLAESNKQVGELKA